MDPVILIQNYHEPACQALVRDFRQLGFDVVSPDRQWECISYYGENANIGSRLISYSDFMRLPSCFILITCKAHEEDLKRLARLRGDRMILNIAQQDFTYEGGISDILLCPDIELFENYPDSVKHKILYLFRPYLASSPIKDTASSFKARSVSSFISMPHFWPKGLLAFNEFKRLYEGPCHMFGWHAPDGHLDHFSCNRQMSASYFTPHFKEKEAYGLSCLESMLLGTPIVSTYEFMRNKTLGRCFLNNKNSVLEETVPQAVKRISEMSYREYVSMSVSARETVLELTDASRTVSVLGKAIADINRGQEDE